MRVKLHMEVLVSRGSSADSAEEGQMVPWDLKCTNCLYPESLQVELLRIFGSGLSSSF